MINIIKRKKCLSFYAFLGKRIRKRKRKKCFIRTPLYNFVITFCVGFTKMVLLSGVRCSFPLPNVIIKSSTLSNIDIPVMEDDMFHKSVHGAGFSKVSDYYICFMGK